jgi:SMP-30/Gluconolactonase/LRE-like region
LRSFEDLLDRGKPRERGYLNVTAGMLQLLVSIMSVCCASSQNLPQNATPPPCVASNGITPICGVHAPEDIELLPDDKHLLISEFPADFSRATGDGLLLVDLATRHVQPLMVSTHSEIGWGERSCYGPPAHFGSHGIHLSKRNDGRMELLVVNHGERESIEALELAHAINGYRAVWRGCVRNRDGVFNDVAATGDGGFIATVMMSRAAWNRSDLLDVMVSGVDTGYLVEWHPGGRLARLPNSEAPVANGVQLSTDRGFIYYTAWTGKQVRKYDRQSGRVVETSNVPFYPDNISVRADGVLVVTGMDELRSWKACVLAKRSFCETGFTVMTLDPVTMDLKPFYHAPPGILPAASVAVQVCKKLYIGSAMGDRLLEVDLSVRAKAHSKKDGTSTAQSRKSLDK